MSSMKTYAGISRKNFDDEKLPLVSPYQWLIEKKNLDGAEDLWRIHDKLYNLNGWLEKHPGGRYWLEVTKGTDITEAFECHHISDKAEKILPKFYVRPAKTKRNSLITFHENGFFKSFKRKIIERNLLGKEGTGPQWKSKIVADGLAVAMFATALLGYTWSSWLLPVSGILLGLLTICAHNFFHMKDNWRMHYFHLSLMSLSDWRVSHALSHHLFPNSSWDLEVSMFQPILNFLPRTKNFKYLSLVISPFVMVALAHVQFLRRIKNVLEKKYAKEKMIGLSLFVFLLLLGDQGPWKAFLSWTATISTSSFIFAFLGLTAAHHHPEIYHEGDFLGNDRDFGIVQLAAVRNRKTIDSSFFISLVSFGNHALHHLFPTVDHSRLPLLEAAFEETCKQFNINFEPFEPRSLIGGMWRQLGRCQTNKFLNILSHKAKYVKKL